MLTNGIFSLLLLAIAHAEGAIFDKSLIIPPSTYKALDPNDPANIKIFQRGLKSVGVPPRGLVLELLGVKETYFLARYVAQYKNNDDLFCTLKFSIGVFSIVRGKFLSCIRIVDREPVIGEVTSTTTTAAPSTVLPTVASVVTVQTEPAVAAQSSESGKDNSNSEDESTVQSVVEVVKEEKQVDVKAGVSKKKETKNSMKSLKKEESLLRAAAEKVQDLVHNLVGLDLAPKKPASAKQDTPSASSQTKVSASINGNLEVDTAKRAAAPLKKLCFDGSLFVKNGDRWFISPEGC